MCYFQPFYHQLIFMNILRNAHDAPVIMALPSDPVQLRDLRLS